MFIKLKHWECVGGDEILHVSSLKRVEENSIGR